ncbi:hypothetical protein SteCoe_7663 [Stentor coeruleus]|uniref:Myb-like DNA-binding domain containing protein n=1 Tax=Stentor coeruleus TaxID=5963 RepID=A0A1R2CM36_9CILI|nr:hypothetical protein SteCoe_7663 [Stentor coeruleus]
MDKKIAPYMLEGEIWMVPCFSNKEGNTFQPIINPLDQSSEFLNLNLRQTWTAEEDQALENLIKLQGTKAWAQIAKELNNIFHEKKGFRKGKQCRERFFNHINPKLKKGDWTIEEDMFILEMQSANGNKWSEISKSLPGRNENQVKNRWKSLINKKKCEKKTESPIHASVSPATTFISYKVDPGFSSLAEIIQAQYYSQANEATPPFHLYFP